MTGMWLTLTQLLYALVSKDRYPCDTAANGLEALRAFQNAQKLYDIVFMGKQTPSRIDTQGSASILNQHGRRLNAGHGRD